LRLKLQRDSVLTGALHGARVVVPRLDVAGFARKGHAAAVQLRAVLFSWNKTSNMAPRWAK
jgi:hypothetical protein